MDNQKWEEFITECEALAKKYGKDMDELKYRLGRVARDERHQQIIEEASKNKDLVGRCFKRPSVKRPEAAIYVKVLSEQSTNEYRVECLSFTTPPTCRFHTKLTMSNPPGTGYLGEFFFDEIHVDDPMAKDIRKMEEVSEDEFRDAMRQYTEQLLDMKWDVTKKG